MNHPPHPYKQTRCTLFSGGAGLGRHDSLRGLYRELQGLMASGQMFWLDLQLSDPGDLDTIGALFGIHPLSLENISEGDLQDKCETYENYIFLHIQTCSHDSKFGLEWSRLYILLFHSFVLTLHERPVRVIEELSTRIARMEKDVAITPNWILYLILDAVVDDIVPNIRAIEREVDSIDDLVLLLSENDQADMLRRIGRARKRVIFMLRLSNPKVEIISSLITRCGSRLDDIVLYLRDIQYHITTLAQSLGHLDDALNRSHSNYLAQINIELTLASNRMNEIVKKLTVYAAIFLPLTLYASIMGMNVPIPGEENVTVAMLGPFFAIVASMLLLTIVSVCVAKRIRWF